MATTTEQIVIIGDLVQIETRTITRSMPLADLIPLIAVPPAITFPRMPMGTRYVRMDPTEQKMTLLVEVGPKLQSMRTSRHTTVYRLTMPYQYYAFTAQANDFANDRGWRLDNWFLFWAHDTITSPQSTVIPAMLPNIYQDRGAICFGSTQPQSNQSISQRIDQIVNEFEVTTFNGDLGWNRPSAYRSFAHWAAESATNPLGWRNWPEWSRARPLQDLLPNAATLIRPSDVTAEGTIPEIRTGWTFGRAGEWLDSLSPVDRYRLIRTLSERRDLTVRLPNIDPDDYPADEPAPVIAAEPEDAAEPPGPVEAEPDLPFSTVTDLLDGRIDPIALEEAVTVTTARRTRTEIDADVAEGLAVYDRAVAAAQRLTGIAIDTTTPEPRCACQDTHCACERVVLQWHDTCAACQNGRHQYP